MKKYISIIVIAALCFGNINSQIIVVDSIISGTQTGNNEYGAVNIQSTQVINSGKTTYTAGNEIVLNPGFEVKLDAEFEAIIDDDALNHLTMMTYNICEKGKRDKHADVILGVNPDVVAIQEVSFLGANSQFKKLKENTGYKGEKYGLTRLSNGGIAILWKPSMGTPTFTKNKIKFKGEGRRGYIIAEFADFVFICAHLSSFHIDTMVNTLLNEDVIKNTQKPIYFAGDFNMEPYDPAIAGTLRNAGFEVLNDTTTCKDEEKGDNCKTYKYWTSHGRFLKDLILECNTNPKRKVIERGVPLTILENLGWKFKGDSNLYPDHYPYYHSTNYDSDHFPYVVKVKIK